MIRKANQNDLPAAAALAAKMWAHDPEELIQGFAETNAAGDGAVFMAEEEGRAVGFAQCALRHDYVEGTETSPVGYLEGVYVDEACRRRGYAAQLLAACESCAKQKRLPGICQRLRADQYRQPEISSFFGFSGS